MEHQVAWKVWVELEDEEDAPHLLGVTLDVGWKGHRLGTLQLGRGVPWSFDQLNFESAAPQIADSSFEHLPKKFQTWNAQKHLSELQNTKHKLEW
jgi:hypothetical protein